MLKPKLINKQAFKKSEGKCYFCDIDDPKLLDVHRIFEGAEGGKYYRSNCITVCANHHRMITTGKMITHRKYLTSAGRYILHYTDEDGQEKWL